MTPKTAAKVWLCLIAALIFGIVSYAHLWPVILVLLGFILFTTAVVVTIWAVSTLLD